MKKTSFLLVVLLSLLIVVPTTFAQKKKLADVKEEVAATDYNDVRIKEIPVAMQCWTFRGLTFYETLDKVEKLGIKYLEAFPGQKIDKKSDRKMGPGLSEADIKEIKGKLNKHGITLRAFGVTNFDNNEEAARKTFEFAKKMGIKVLDLEPKYDDYSIIEKMVKEYNIAVGIHNHPKNSKYWNPETVMKNIEGLDKRIGYCADTGHWLRSGINPVEALRYGKGRIINVHLKDLDQFGVKEAQDVPFGYGKANIHDIMAELTLQNYRGTVSVEFERKDEQPDPSKSIAKGLKYLDGITYYKGYQELIGWGGRDSEIILNMDGTSTVQDILSLIKKMELSRPTEEWVCSGTAQRNLETLHSTSNINVKRHLQTPAFFYVFPTLLPVMNILDIHLKFKLMTKLIRYTEPELFMTLTRQ